MEHGKSSVELDAISLNTNWRFSDQNPIISLGQLRQHGYWNDPCIRKFNEIYVMYMTSNRAEAFKTPVVPFRAVSTDGLSWTLDPDQPLLSIAGTAYAKIETPDVVYFKGEYHMYFTGVYPEGEVPTMAIGHAVSADGKNWKISQSEPVLKGTGNLEDWNGYTVAEPGALVVGDTIYLYFTAAGRRVGEPPIKQVIGLAKSRDGITFDKPLIVLEQSALYSAENGFAGYSTPSALWADDEIHLFYDVVHSSKSHHPEWLQVALHHAVSKDGIHFVQDEKAIARQGMNEWLASEVRSPTVIFEEDRFRMWFAGHGDLGTVLKQLKSGRGDLFGIGYAEILKADL